MSSQETPLAVTVGTLLRRPVWYSKYLHNPLEKLHFETAVWKIVGTTPGDQVIVQLVRTDCVQYQSCIGSEELLHPTRDLTTQRWEVVKADQLELPFPTVDDERFDLEVEET